MSLQEFVYYSWNFSTLVLVPVDVLAPPLLLWEAMILCILLCVSPIWGALWPQSSVGSKRFDFLLLLFSFFSCCENRRDDFQVPYMSYQKLEVRTSVSDCFILASLSAVLLAFLDVQLTCSTLWLALGILTTISSFLHIWLLWTPGSWMYHRYKTWKQQLNFFFLFMFCCYMTIYWYLRLLSKRRLISLWPKSVS